MGGKGVGSKAYGGAQFVLGFLALACLHIQQSQSTQGSRVRGIGLSERVQFRPRLFRFPLRLQLQSVLQLDLDSEFTWEAR